MAFQPDILVTIPGEPRVTMVIEAKTSLPGLNRTEQELKRYMGRNAMPHRSPRHPATSVALPGLLHHADTRVRQAGWEI